MSKWATQLWKRNLTKVMDRRWLHVLHPRLFLAPSLLLRLVSIGADTRTSECTDVSEHLRIVYILLLPRALLRLRCLTSDIPLHPSDAVAASSAIRSSQLHSSARSVRIRIRLRRTQDTDTAAPIGLIATLDYQWWSECERILTKVALPLKNLNRDCIKFLKYILLNIHCADRS